jgi:hypothetical protein
LGKFSPALQFDHLHQLQLLKAAGQGLDWNTANDDRNEKGQPTAALLL